jgi:hypothetical protein
MFIKETIIFINEMSLGGYKQVSIFNNLGFFVRICKKGLWYIYFSSFLPPAFIIITIIIIIFFSSQLWVERLQGMCD